MMRSTIYWARRGAAWVKRRLPRLPRAAEPVSPPYSAWMQDRVRDRLKAYPAVEARCLFSLMTPVFDPPVGYFRQLGKSIFAQDHADWQWVLVDNGCRNRDVLFLLEQFARDPRVTLVRAGEPRGIIGGMRLALEQASGRYVCPVDHDDRLYPDALRVVAACLQARDWPTLAYTDEDKLLPDGQPGLPSFKPDWDPLLFLNACYIAHLGVMNRQRGLELGLYTDPQAEGTPDGDAFSRFVAAGHDPVHIPEIVYSWRMHEQSTAMLGVDAKPYVTANQKHVLSRFLEKQGLARHIRVRTNSIPGVAGSWRVEAQGIEPVPVYVLPGGTLSSRRALQDRLHQARYVRSIHWLRSTRDIGESLTDDDWLILLSPDCVPLTTDFVQELTSVVQARSGSVLAGGLLQDDKYRVVSAGLAWGMGGLMDSPLTGIAANDFGIGQGSLCFQRTVSSVDQRFCMVQAGFLRHALERFDTDLADPLLPAWLGVLAREQGSSVVFTPHAAAQVHVAGVPRQVNEADRYRFLRAYGQWLAVDPYYARFLGLTAETAYQPVKPMLRTMALKRTLSALADAEPRYQEWAGSKTQYQSFLDDDVPAASANEQRQVA